MAQGFAHITWRIPARGQYEPQARSPTHPFQIGPTTHTPRHTNHGQVQRALAK